MLIPEEEHNYISLAGYKDVTCARIIKFIHLVKVCDFVDINQLEDCKILAFVCDAV